MAAKFKALFNGLLKRNRKNKNARDMLNFIGDLKGSIITYDSKLKGTPIYALNPESSDYKKAPRILTNAEMTKYIKNRKQGKPVTKSSNMRNYKIVDYTEKRNRI